MEQQAVIDFFDRAAANWDAQLVRNEAVIGKILDNAGSAPAYRCWMWPAGRAS